MRGGRGDSGRNRGQYARVDGVRQTQEGIYLSRVDSSGDGKGEKALVSVAVEKNSLSMQYRGRHARDCDWVFRDWGMACRRVLW